MSAVLTTQQIQQLIDAQKTIANLKNEIERAKAAGLDVTAQEQQLLGFEKQIQQLLMVYGPPPTTKK